MSSSRFCIKIDVLAQVSSLAPVGDVASWCNQLPAEKFGHSKRVSLPFLGTERCEVPLVAA